MPRTRYNGLSKAGRSRKSRKHSSVATRAKYQAPTARNQRKQILGNAKMIQHIRSQMPRNIYCDYQQLNSIVPEPSTNTNPVTFTTNGRALTAFNNWVAVMRESLVAANKSSTRIYRMQLNIRYTLQTSYWAQISLFIVTLRKDSSGRDFQGTNVLEYPSDFIGNIVGVANDPAYLQNIRLNSDVFRVHYARHVTLSGGNYLLPPVEFGGIPASGAPSSTWKKGQVNLKLNMNVRNPTTPQPWTAIPFENLSPYQRYYLITCVSQQAAPGTTPASSVVIDTDLLACTMNSG